MLGYFSTGHQQRCQGSGLAGAGTISSHWCHRFMQKGGLLRLIEPLREPMKKLSASSRQDVPMRWRAEVCSLSPRWGQLLPTTAAGHSSTAPAAHTISPSHHCAHTPSSCSQPNRACSTGSHCSSLPTLWSYLCRPPLPLRRSALSVRHLALGHWCIWSSTAVPVRG